MRFCDLHTAFLAMCLAAGLTAPATRAATVTLGPGSTTENLQQALINAGAGDVVEVVGGTFDGPLYIDSAVHLVGREWPTLDGQGSGTVLQIRAEGAGLRGFIIRGSGNSLDRENSGIAVEAPNVTVEDNRLDDTLFGIYLRRSHGSVIRRNVIRGKDLEVPRRGDPIRVWYSNHVRIEENDISFGRDVVLWYSSDLHVADNLVRDGRYGLHFMYCDDALIVRNRLVSNSVGAFLMYSRRLHMLENTVAHNRGPSGYGIGLKDMDDAVIENTLFVGNRVGAYVDNSPRELDSTTRFSGCVFAYNDVGVRLLPLVKRNVYAQNSFISNLEQVEVTGGGTLEGNEWTQDGRGNYWSDYAGYDADQDGIGDMAYRSQRFFEHVVDRQPAFRLFLHSPSAGALDFAAQAFPLFQPQPKLTDAAPLMSPVVPENLPALRRASTTSMALASTVLALAGGALLGLARFPKHGDAPGTKRTEVDASESGAAGATPIVSIRNLRMKFGRVVALDQVSFDIVPGQAVALWGPNGAGKTTLLRCLLGLLPYRGSVTVAGHDSRRDGKAARRQIGFVPQELHFHDNMSVMETLVFYARLKKASRSECDALIERLELAGQVRKQVGDLSGGMKQRLALAVALLGDPPILLLDEPTANLDLQSRESFLHLLAELKDAGKTLIFCSHHLDEVVSASERIVVLEDGKLFADCSPDELDLRLGWRTTVWLGLSDEHIDDAMRTLSDQGFAPQRNHRGILVPVETRAKAAPVNAVARAGIPLRDFSYAMDRRSNAGPADVEAH